MNEFSHFTSLPPEQEAAFIPFEQKQAQSLKSGSTAGLIAGIGIGVLMILIALGVEPHKDPHAESSAPASQTQKAESGK